MANFKTHLVVASGISGLAAIACMKAGVAPSEETPALLGLGTLGGLLPDVDSGHSVPIRISFNLLAFTLAFLVMFRFVGQCTVMELAALWLGVFLGVRYLVLGLFVAFTTHRGAIHSLLAGALFALGTVSLSYHLFSKPYRIAWIHGAFVALGFVIHLLLDELFSVDLLNRRVKRSFGSALKLISLQHRHSTLLLLVATMAVYSTVSYPTGLYSGAWNKLKSHYNSRHPWLMPAQGQWFDGIQAVVKSTLNPARSAVQTSPRSPSAP